MKYKLAVSPINWRNDDLPDIGASNTMDKFLTEAANIGYDGVELGAQFPKDKAELQSLLASYNLSLASGWFDIGLLQKPVDEQMEEIKPHLELLRAMDCKLVIVCETQKTTVHSNPTKSVNDRHIMTNDEWQTLMPRLNDFAGRLKDMDMPISYHPHIGTVIETEKDIDRLLNECQKLNLLYDAGHLAYAGADPLSCWKTYEPRINHVHLKDVRRSVVRDVRDNNRSFLDGVRAGTFTVPSDGDIDFVEILLAINSSEYHGWLVVEAEQDPDIHPADEYAQKAIDFIKTQIL